MNLNAEISTNDSKSTAFRLPTALLETIDKWCVEHEITHSQFLRYSIADRVRWPRLASMALPNPEQQQK